MIRASRPTRRHAISLLEVLVALAIFVMSLVALSQIIRLGADQAMEIENQARAVQMCKSKLDEIAAGIVPLQSAGDEPFDEDPDWTWSVDAEQRTDVTGLWKVKVTVRHSAGPGRAKVEYTLSQLVFDPSQRGSSLDAAPSPSSGSSTSGGSGSSGGSAPAGGAAGGGGNGAAGSG
jgi:type II secretion system protein I